VDAPRVPPGKVLPTSPLPAAGSHQHLLSGLWQPESNQAAPDEGRGGQKDGDHFGDPNKVVPVIVPIFRWKI